MSKTSHGTLDNARFLTVGAVLRRSHLFAQRLPRAIAAGIAVGLLVGIVPSAIGHARQTDTEACTLATIQRVYTSRLSGMRQQPDGTMVEVANISRYVRDGQGNYSATTVENAGGTIAHLTTTGTYTLSPDCTGTQEGIGATGAVTHYELVVAKNGDAVELLRTDAPVLSGTQIRQ